MAAAEAIEGWCLCGAATFHARLTNSAMHACHCAMCRRSTGGMLFYLPVEDLRTAGLVGLYKSSAWGKRGFCQSCGSSLFWRVQDGSAVDVSAKAVDDPGRFPFASEMFVEEKSSNYEFANATVKRTGAEVSAAHLRREST